MKKFEKKDYFNILILSLIYILVVLLITHGTNLFGSSLDWEYQHWALPEYFRNLFYKTHDLIPDFAFNLGGGQNIYYFAYYGFLNPIILFSYLLPFIPMHIYISVSMIILGIFSTILFYKWLLSHKFDRKICFITSLLFLCAGPLIFHSHRHIMFVDYFLFIIMGLFGVDRYFEKGKGSLLALSVFLMIMTSYFYSVGGLICLTIYGVYVYLTKNDKFDIKDFVKNGFKFAFVIITGIMMSLVLLLPTIYVLKNGRIGDVNAATLLSTLIPKFGLENLLYSPYAVGLTGICVIALFSILILKKKQYLFLSISLLCFILFPVFVFLLNGMLYVDGKALIPFLPLYCFVIAIFLDKVFNKKIDFYQILFMYAITLLLTILFANQDIAVLYILDASFMMVLFYNFYKTENFKKFLIIFSIFIAIICISLNFCDKLVSYEKFNVQNNNEVEEIIKQITKEDKDIYRISVNLNKSGQVVNKVVDIREYLTTLYSSTYNKNYNNFLYREFNNNIAFRNTIITNQMGNNLFEKFMGVKYLITDKNEVSGYNLLFKKGKYFVYKNENTLPIGYASSNIISDKQYSKLKYPYNIETILNNVIVSNARDKELNSKFKKIDLNLEEGIKDNLDISKIDNSYIFKTSKSGKLSLKLKENIGNKLLLIRMKVSNPQTCEIGDTYIEINGIKNKLTCKQWKYFNRNYDYDYTLSNPNGFDTLNFNFSNGVHRIDEVSAYTLDLKDILNDVDEFKMDYDKTIGDKISGEVNVLNDGYFVFSIPYDEGFDIKVDGKKVSYNMVNRGFIGFPITKGLHNIELKFTAPNSTLGKFGSVCGIVIFSFICINDLRKRRK